MRKFPKPCLTCGTLSLERLCPTHQALEVATHEARRRATKSATKQYSGSYNRRAKQVRQNAIQCHICKEGKRINDPFEADHINPAENGDTAILLPAHRSCNQRRGNAPLTPGGN